MGMARNAALVEFEQSAETKALREHDAREQHALHEKLEFLEVRLADASATNALYAETQLGYQEYILQLQNDPHVANAYSELELRHLPEDIRHLPEDLQLPVFEP